MEAGVKRPFHPHGGSGERNEARGLESFILVTVGWVCMVPSVLLEVITSSSDNYGQTLVNRAYEWTRILQKIYKDISLTTRFLTRLEW